MYHASVIETQGLKFKDVAKSVYCMKFQMHCPLCRLGLAGHMGQFLQDGKRCKLCLNFFETLL